MSNIYVMIFMMNLFMLGTFMYCLHAKNAYFKGNLFRRFIPIIGIVISISGLIFAVYAEMRAF